MEAAVGGKSIGQVGAPAEPIRWVARGGAHLPDAYQVGQWDRAEVILKVSERCHLNCSYCYFFNGGDESYLRHAPLITEHTVQSVAEFLARTAVESGLKSIQVDLHGGEPTLLKKHRFDAMCATLRRVIGAVTRLDIALQTSATLLDDEWIEIFARHDIHVGVSIDGPREFNDANRLDHQGRGTYDAAVAGLRLLQSAHAQGRLKFAPGIICVANPKHDGRQTLNHLVDDLGVKGLHFVFPLRTWDEHDPVELDGFVHYMVDMFDAWVERGDRSVSVRYLESFLSLLLGGKRGIEFYEATLPRQIAMTITSDGEVVGADDERVASYAFDNGFMVAKARTVSQVMGTVPMQRYAHEVAMRSAECTSCCWGRLCKGGVPLAGATQRHSMKDGFANKSVFCEGIKALLVRMTRHAMSNGVKFEQIEEVLVR
jgi:uncharacterized protein